MGGFHVTNSNKYNFRDVGGGSFIPNRVVNQQACDLVSVLAVKTVNASLTPTEYSAVAGDFAAQPLHPRPIRLSWSATAGTVGRVMAVLYGKDFWNNNAREESKTLTATGHVDFWTSLRKVDKAVFYVNGTPGSSADVSLGLGVGTGAHERFSDVNLAMPGNLDILAVRNDTTAAYQTLVALRGDPYNTIIATEDEATPPDIQIEMQSHFDQLGRG